MSVALEKQATEQAFAFVTSVLLWFVLDQQPGRALARYASGTRGASEERMIKRGASWRRLIGHEHEQPQWL